jgi:heterodisulfide reductase subunit D
MTKLDLSRFSFWQLMQMDACTRCGECVAWCPTFTEAQRDEITPLQKLSRFRSFAKGERGGFLARLFGHRPPTDSDLDVFSKGAYDCTLCARCRVVCPVHIETRPLWISMREAMVAQGRVPALFNTLRDTVTGKYNISGDDNSQRMIWSENLEETPSGLVGRAGADTVYFAGCVSSFYPAVYGVTQAFVSILARAGANFTMLGGDEWCCGFPLRIAGMGDSARELMRHNVQSVRALGAKRLVTTCPSCYHTWKHEYPELMGEPLGFEVVHAVEMLADLVESDALQLNPIDAVVTYHDPCDLGRTSGIYEAPRRIIRAIPGVEFKEMEDHHELALCCGGGGDAEMANAELTQAVGKRRLAQAQATGAAYVLSACQQCKRTLAAAARREKARVRVLDVVELVWQAMQD